MKIPARPRRSLLGLVAIALALATAGAAAAQVVTVPPGLIPGDQYRLAFVTSWKIAGSSTSISSYDSLVQGQATVHPDLNALGTTWRAIASTSTTDAIVHTNTGTHPPIYRLDGVRIADADQLWVADLEAPLNVAPDGFSYGVQVWTGTGSSGHANVELGNALSLSTTGHSTSADFNGWISSGSDAQIIQHHLYGISDVLTVPTPPECTSDATLTTQAEVDAYPCVTQTGNLTIGTSSDITNLGGLEGLTSVSGTLDVHDNAALVDLDGLAGLASVGGNLEVSTNGNLAFFCGLFPLLDTGGLSGSYTVASNLANPIEADVLAGGPCGEPTLLGAYAVFTSSQGTADANGRKDAMIDRSGLSGTGPLEFQTHDAASVVSSKTIWFAGTVEGGLGPGATGSPPAVADQEVVFDLGAPRDLVGSYVWNRNHGLVTDNGVDQFEILTSGDSDPLTATFTSVGVFNLAEAGGTPAEPAHFLAFSAAGARLVKFDIQTAHSGAPNDFVGLSEVIFATRCATHRWRFDDAAGSAPDGTTATDSTCGADGTILGNGATFTGGGIALTGGSQASGAPYVDLPNGLISAHDEITIEVWYEIGAPRWWTRLFDFGDSAGNEVPPSPIGGHGTHFIAYRAMQGLDPSLHDVVLTDGVDTGNVNMSTATSLATPYHLAVTFTKDASGPGQHLVSAYRNGFLEGQTSTTAELGNLNDVNSWIGRSNAGNEHLFEGRIDEFRIYDQALTPLQVANSYYEGPDVDTVALPEPGPATGLGSGLGLLLILARRRRTKAIV